ncbi:MAG: hypothetical protein SGARI_000743 [Bacillariaceae sp.]
MNSNSVHALNKLYSEYHGNNAAQEKVHCGDFAGAKSLAKKALKLDHRRPDAYATLAQLFDQSQNFTDSVPYWEKAAEKCAVALLMKRVGDTPLDGEKEFFLLTQWTIAISKLTYSYTSRLYTTEDAPKANWYTEGPSLQRVSRYAMTIFENGRNGAHIDSPYQYAVTARAYSLLGSNPDTKHGLYPQGAKRELISPEEWKEGARMLLLASKTRDPEKSQYMQSHARDILEWLRDSPNFIEVENRDMTAGQWVILHDLQSAAGAKLNGKLGRITNDERENGRIPVQVGGAGNSAKSFKPENLKQIEYPDKFLALSACLQEQSQWAFMKTLFGPEAFC